MGFLNYLDVKGGANKEQLQTADKVIVQLDSIGMVLPRQRVIPQYDLLVLDEMENTLHHATAKTHGNKQRATFDTFCSIIQQAHRVLAADALLGRETRSFLKALGKEPQIVRNTWRTHRPRTFVFTNKQDTWLKTLVRQLRAGRNCAVASMSATKVHLLCDYLVEKGILKRKEILVYDAQTDDAVKRRVRHVNEDWVRYRLVMWSPAVEAGLDFNVPHFHSLFVILCNKSTVAMGALQSIGRIRKLEDRRVLCWCQQGVAWDPRGHEMRPEEAVEQLRWHHGLIQHQKLDNFEANIMPVCEEPLKDGEVALLPAADTAGMVVASHNYARIINSRMQLLPVFLGLLEQQGHKWKRGAWQFGVCEPPTDPLGTRSKASIMLAAPVIEVEQLDKLLILQRSCQLTTEEKHALARHYYCQHHMINNAELDIKFLDHHRSPHCPHHSLGLTHQIG